MTDTELTRVSANFQGMQKSYIKMYSVAKITEYFGKNILFYHRIDSKNTP